MKAEGRFKLVKLNIDNLPELANGLQVRSIPAVFLIHKGNLVDKFIGIPKQEVLDEFINTALAIESMSHDEAVMEDLISRAEGYINENKLDIAEKVLVEGYSYENWRDKFGP